MSRRASPPFPDVTAGRRTIHGRTWQAACLGVLLLLLSGPGVAARMPAPQSDPGAGLPPPAPATPGAGQAAADNVPEAVREARAQLERGDGEITAQTLAAKTLLDAGDLATLRLILNSGTAKPVSGLLRALHELPPASFEQLLSEILGLAARGPSDQVRSLAQLDLVRLAEARPSVRDTCIGWLQDPALDAARRVAVIEALGSARNLVAVEPLIRALDGSQANEARAALKRLTRHDEGPAADRAAWTAWWDAHRNLPRDALLDLEFDAQSQQYDKLLEAKTAEVVRSRIDRMDADIERLITGLSDEYPEVRLQAAARLAQHDNKEQAATAVPLLLRRLGHPFNGNGTGSAPTAPVGTSAAGSVVLPPAAIGSVPSAKGAANEGTPALEVDPGVRAQFVTTLGALGRTRDDVRVALLKELQTSPYGAVTAAAALALSTLRDQPSIVEPLLDYLERTPGEDNAVMVLQAVALNRPVGVIPRLTALASPPQPPRVRAAAVRALMAGENTAQALDRLQQMYVSDDSTEVRFAMAVALGDRLRALPPEAPERARSISLMGSLLDDVAPNVRVEAASALGKTGAPTALKLLEARAGAETEASVLIAIVQALGSLHLQEAAPVIGRIVAQRKTPTPGLEPAAQAALAVLADKRQPADWLALADALLSSESAGLAAWSYAEIVRQFEPLPENRDLVERARAGLARAYVAAGQAENALKVLDQLEAANAPYPSPAERLLLQARACEALGRDGEAANYYAKRLALLPEGEAGRTTTRRAWATALRKAGRLSEALPLLRTLSTEDSGNNALLFELAQVEETLQQWPQAQVDLDRLLSRLAEGDAALRTEAQAALDRVRSAQAAHPAEPPAAPGATPATSPPAPNPAAAPPKEKAPAPTADPVAKPDDKSGGGDTSP